MPITPLSSFIKGSDDVRLTREGHYTTVSRVSDWEKRLNAQQKDKYSGYLGSNNGHRLVRFYPANGEMYSGPSASTLVKRANRIKGLEKGLPSARMLADMPDLMDSEASRLNIKEALQRETFFDARIVKLKNVLESKEGRLIKDTSTDFSLSELKNFSRHYGQLKKALEGFVDGKKLDKSISGKELAKLDTQVKTLIARFGEASSRAYGSMETGVISSFFRKLPIGRKYYARKARRYLLNLRKKAAQEGKKYEYLLSGIANDVARKSGLKASIDLKTFSDSKGRKVDLSFEQVQDIAKDFFAIRLGMKRLEVVKKRFMLKYDKSVSLSEENWANLCERNGASSESFKDREWLFKLHYGLALEEKFDSLARDKLKDGDLEKLSEYGAQIANKAADDVFQKLKEIKAEEASKLISVGSYLKDMGGNMARSVKEGDVSMLANVLADIGGAEKNWSKIDAVLKKELAESPEARTGLSHMLLNLSVSGLDSKDKAMIYDKITSSSNKVLPFLLGVLSEDVDSQSTILDEKASEQDFLVALRFRLSGLQNVQIRLRLLVMILGDDLGKTPQDIRSKLNELDDMFSRGENLRQRFPVVPVEDKAEIASSILSETSRLFTLPEGDVKDSLTAFGDFWTKRLPKGFANNRSMVEEFRDKLLV